MRSNTKQALLVTVVGVTLFVALLRLSDVLAFAAQLVDLVLPILAGGILALFLSVPMAGLEKRLGRLFAKARKQPSGKALHLLSFLLTLLGVVLVLVLVAGVLLYTLIGSGKSGADRPDPPKNPTEDVDPNQPATPTVKLSLDQTALELTVGGTGKLTATGAEGITWTSSNAGVAAVGEDGTVIVCGEDPHLVELAKSTGRHVLSYGFAENNDIVCVHPDVKGIQSDFIVRFEDGTEHAVEIKSNPGRHNMLNATAVLTVAHVLGLDIDAAAKALSSFEGVRRRFTHVGDIDGITVVDDYGHHPTEIKATLAAASSLGYKHVDVVFQPHRYSRLQALCDDFADAFANADKLLLIDVFSAGEMPIPGVTSKMLADTVRAKHPGKEVVYCSSRLELNQELEKLVGEGDLLLTMGAGDVTTVGPEFIEYLTAKKDA